MDDDRLWYIYVSKSPRSNRLSQGNKCPLDAMAINEPNTLGTAAHVNAPLGPALDQFARLPDGQVLVVLVDLGDGMNLEAVLLGHPVEPAPADVGARDGADDFELAVQGIVDAELDL